MSDVKHPYQVQPERAHWRRAVSEKHPLAISDWYQRKFEIGTLPVATAGSCFAQHIGRQLRDKGFNYVDAEPAPSFLNAGSRQDFGYEMYSARYGNVYTARQLLQLLQRAYGEFVPKEDYWVKDDGVVDPFRPTIESEPFSSVAELRESREHHLECVRKVFEQARIFVFTMGLTEAWVGKADGAVYPVAPGVSGGTYSKVQHELRNFAYPGVMKDMTDFITSARRINSRLRFLLTVSPVPLMATATGKNVLVATTYSKSVLRAVAGALADAHAFVDYFPSYEIISSHVMRGFFYNPDQRTVNSQGVEHVMQQFFANHAPPASSAKAPAGVPATRTSPEDTRDAAVCDEELLRVFGA